MDQKKANAILSKYTAKTGILSTYVAKDNHLMATNLKAWAMVKLDDAIEDGLYVFSNGKLRAFNMYKAIDFPDPPVPLLSLSLLSPDGIQIENPKFFSNVLKEASLYTDNSGIDRTIDQIHLTSTGEIRATDGKRMFLHKSTDNIPNLGYDLLFDHRVVKIPHIALCTNISYIRHNDNSYLHFYNDELWILTGALRILNSDFPPFERVLKGIKYEDYFLKFNLTVPFLRPLKSSLGRGLTSLQLAIPKANSIELEEYRFYDSITHDYITSDGFSEPYLEINYKFLCDFFYNNPDAYLMGNINKPFYTPWMFRDDNKTILIMPIWKEKK